MIEPPKGKLKKIATWWQLIKSQDIQNPKTAICECGHKWSWHYIDSNNNICYYHKITGKEECVCKGYKE